MRLALLLLLSLAFATPVGAQIYSWHDAKGNLVLSDKPSGAALRTYAVPRAASLRATRPLRAGVRWLYDDVISEHAQLNGVSPDLVRAVVQVESAFNPYARSPKGAAGLMQLMPATMQQFGVKNPFDPVENVRAGVAYLRQLLDRYQNNEQLALAAYNAGPSTIDRYGQNVPPFRETQEYVSRINRMVGRPVGARGLVVYKTTEIVDGRSVPRYSDRKPQAGSYELVGR